MTELKWGETPFDHMTPEELRMACLRMYSACEAAHGSLVQLREGDEWNLGRPNPYFRGHAGVGRRAISKLEQVLEPVKQAFGEDVWRYFRYADDLLFTGVGSNWMKCPKCACFWGTVLDAKPSEKCPACDGPLQPICWEDLKPKASEEREP